MGLEKTNVMWIVAHGGRSKHEALGERAQTIVFIYTLIGGAR